MNQARSRERQTILAEAIRLCASVQVRGVDSGGAESRRREVVGGDGRREELSRASSVACGKARGGLAFGFGSRELRSGPNIHGRGRSFPVWTIVPVPGAS